MISKLKLYYDVLFINPWFGYLAFISLFSWLLYFVFIIHNIYFYYKNKNVFMIDNKYRIQQFAERNMLINVLFVSINIFLLAILIVFVLFKLR